MALQRNDSLFTLTFMTHDNNNGRIQGPHMDSCEATVVGVRGYLLGLKVPYCQSSVCGDFMLLYGYRIKLIFMLVGLQPNCRGKRRFWWQILKPASGIGVGDCGKCHHFTPVDCIWSRYLPLTHPTNGIISLDGYATPELRCNGLTLPRAAPSSHRSRGVSKEVT